MKKYNIDFENTDNKDDEGCYDKTFSFSFLLKDGSITNDKIQYNKGISKYITMT